MTTTIADLIARLEDTYLYPPSERPAEAILTAISATTLTLDTTPLSDMAAELGGGITVEVDQERMLATGWTAASSVLTVNRPNPTTHAVGSRVRIAPEWSRASIFEAIADAIADLWPPLYLIRTSPVSLGSAGWVPAPADMLDVIGYTFSDGSIWDDADLAYIGHHPWSPTGVLQFPGGVPGTSGFVTYKARPPAPASEATKLESLGITDRSWLRIIMISALSQLIAGRDLPKTTLEFITGALEAEAAPVGVNSDLRNGLLSYHRYLVERAADRQAVAVPEHVSFGRVARSGW